MTRILKMQPVIRTPPGTSVRYSYHPPHKCGGARHLTTRTPFGASALNDHLPQKRHRAGQGRNDYTNLTHDLSAGTAGKRSFIRCFLPLRIYCAAGAGEKMAGPPLECMDCILRAGCCSVLPRLWTSGSAQVCFFPAGLGGPELPYGFQHIRGDRAEHR